MVRQVSVGCGIVELADEGREAPTGGPIVLLHGFTGSKDSWLGLRELLGTKRRVLSVDLPGHGGTKIVGNLSRYSIESTADGVIEALDSLGIGRFSLIGYSMGGRLALFMALHFGERIESLVLESASAGIASADEGRRRRAADEDLAQFVASAGIAAFVDRWERMPLFESQRQLPLNVRMNLRRARLSCEPAGLAASLRAMGTGSQPWLGARLHELKLPVLIVVGALDDKYVKIGGELAAGITGARLAVVAGAGHTVHLERDTDFNRLVTEFIATAVDVSNGEKVHGH